MTPITPSTRSSRSSRRPAAQDRPHQAQLAARPTSPRTSPSTPAPTSSASTPPSTGTKTHVLLKAAFPLAHSGPKATFEIPYGAIERPTTRDNSWEKAQFEVPALRWADLGDATAGVSILNDSKYGYDALGNTLRLTLLRSPTWPDPDADRGLAALHLRDLSPHRPLADSPDRPSRLRTQHPAHRQQVFPHTGTLPPTHSFARIDEPNIILSAVKKAEDANALIFRFYEATGKGTDAHLHIPPGALYAIETNLMETPLPNAPHLPLASDTITLPIQPWEIRTLEVVYPKSSEDTPDTAAIAQTSRPLRSSLSSSANLAAIATARFMLD